MTFQNTYSKQWSMKTSLNIDDSVYEDAKRAAMRHGKTLSETISEWARLGRNVERARKRRKPKLHSVDLGPARVSFASRNTLLDELDDYGA